MDSPVTLEKLQLLLGKVGESQTLEYKGGRKLNNSSEAKDSITKSVSAMANAVGGIVIFGISEHQDNERRHLPEKFSPIDCSEYTREWLDQILGQIQPKITGLKIHDVHVGPKPTDYCYVVEVPQGVTAHQATDLRYHKRRNFEITSMLDYEIRDVMNRHSAPDVTVEIKLVDPHYDTAGRLQVKFLNKGKIFARDYQAIFQFPTILNNRSISFIRESTSLEKSGDSYYWNIGAGKGLAGGLLYPGTGVILSLEFEYDKNPVARVSPSISDIRVNVYADMMPAKSLIKKLDTAWSHWT